MTDVVPARRVAERSVKFGRDAFLLLALVPVLLGATILWSVLRFRSDSDQVEHVHETLTTISDLEASLTQAESSVRGYFSSEDPSFLAEFQQHRIEAAGDAEHLRKLAANNSQQLESVNRLSAAVAERIDFLSAVSKLREAGNPKAEINSSHSAEARRLIAVVRTATDAARSEQEQMLAAWRIQRRHTEIAVLVLCGAAILVSCAVAFRGARTTGKYLHSLEALNANLEQRVAERTIALAQANSDLQHAQLALQRSNVDLESFAYAVSHEVQEPLRTITTYLELLRLNLQGKLDAESDEFINNAIEGAARLRLLVRDLMEYSRVGASALSRESVSLDAVLKQVLLDLQVAIQESDAIITHGALPSVQGDAACLALLLRNLLSNALKFRQPNLAPRIQVAARRQDHEWIISVEDNGIGFEADYAARIFKMFQRLHGHAEYPGNGIGLGLVARIADMHGGRAWAESTLGKGSTFHVSVSQPTK